MSDRLRVGVSRCLLGDEVRYDGGHKRAPWVLDTAGVAVEWIAVCPEVEVGMSVPREPIQLVARRGGVTSAAWQVRLIGAVSGADWTDRMDSWARGRLRELRLLNLSGYVLKARSPSCGPIDVPLRFGGAVSRAPAPPTGRGVFAQALIEAIPDLPVADEESLLVPEMRRAFLARVVDYQRRRHCTG